MSLHCQPAFGVRRSAFGVPQQGSQHLALCTCHPGSDPSGHLNHIVANAERRTPNAERGALR